jgi:formylglycine-generating enzyme required for sulfatase activity
LAAELVVPGQNDLLMFHRVRVAVMDRTNGDQVPWTEDGIQRRERVMFGREAKVAPVAPTQPPVTEAEVAWRWAKDTTNQAVLENFIKQFNDTPFAAMARARLEELRKQQAAAPASPPAAKPSPAPAPALPKPVQPAVGLPPPPPASRCDDVAATVGNERSCLKPKDTFKDCPECPEMVVIPSGSYMMGSPATEKGREEREGPQRKVTVARPFAVGKYEATFAEWDACVTAGGCKHSPDDLGSGRGKQPVVMVNWDDITKEYLPWLSQRTGRTYRLLTEAEWEYAARAGTTTPFWTGLTITREQANFGALSALTGAVATERSSVLPADSFLPNPWGLFQVHGNVSEWVEDCWHATYRGAPADGSAWTTGDCSNRVVRGGDWGEEASDLRSARRRYETPRPRGRWTGRYSTTGFRVARALD